MELVALFDERIASYFAAGTLSVRGFEYLEYENGMSQVVGKPCDVMHLIGGLATTSAGLVEAWVPREDQ